jgi:hypothetical protein
MDSLQDALKASGINISNEPPIDLSTPDVTPQSTDSPDSIFNRPADIDATALGINGDAPATPDAQPAAQITEPQTATPVEPQIPASSLSTEPQASADDDISDSEIESVIASYLSEKLGLQLDSVDAIANMLQQQKQADIDERVSVIADFVSKTGRSPEDWFKYQSLNPSEMDDVTAVRLQFATKYPNLSQDEVQLLVNSKYKVDSDMYSDDEVRLSSLQLKIDAEEARKAINEIRDSYMLPEVKSSATQEVESPIDANWISTMSQEVDSMDTLDFDLGADSEFKFGIPQEYKSSLKQKNAKLDEFFDQYVGQNGAWNFELLNSHRALIDNIDDIAKSIYRQGLHDGQRNLVTKAANVDISSPTPSGQPTGQDLIAKQLMEALNSRDGILRFK